MSTVTRKTKWHPTPPPPPSPKVLHFPRSRRTRRRQLKSAVHLRHRHHHQQQQQQQLRLSNTMLLTHQQHYLANKGKLENLFDQENQGLPGSHESSVVFLNSNTTAFKRRERVETEEEEEEEEEEESGVNDRDEEEKWRFQTEILRAECNFLRMEREFALKKLEKNRIRMERTLRSAVQTLDAGREKIFQGKNVSAVVKEEIEDLAEKLEELQKSSRIKDHQVKKCCNFDKKSRILQRQLEKLGGFSDERLTESNLFVHMSPEIDQVSNFSNCKTKNKPTDVDDLNRKMEGLSKGILDRGVEDYGSIIFSTANSSVASSASTSKRIDQYSELSALSSRQLYQDTALNKCSGRCKAIVRRIVEQVRSETEQWSQMQEMLKMVRGEMEQLKASRDYWENQAHNSHIEVQSLRLAVDEWKEKALGHETKTNEMQLELSLLKEELEKVKACHYSEETLNQDQPKAPVRKQLEKETTLICGMKETHYFDERRGKVKSYMDDDLNIEDIKSRTPTKDFPPISLGKQLAKEKKMLLHRLNENRRATDRKTNKKGLSAESRRNDSGAPVPKRSPLKDISGIHHHRWHDRTEE